MKYSIYSWNVNGIRASAKKGIVDWMQKTDMDVLCVQETKAPDDFLKNFDITSEK